MTQLGSIFEPESEEGPRGRDLRHEVTVPAWVAGHDAGVLVEVPRELPGPGGHVTRAVSELDGGTNIPLRLPTGFPSGGALRLRGQGEVCDGGRPGDLLLIIHLDPGQTTAPAGSQPDAALTWSPGQVLATSPAAPFALVAVVFAVFAIGAVIVLAL